SSPVPSTPSPRRVCCWARERNREVQVSRPVRVDPHLRARRRLLRRAHDLRTGREIGADSEPGPAAHRRLCHRRARDRRRHHAASPDRTEASRSDPRLDRPGAASGLRVRAQLDVLRRGHLHRPVGGGGVLVGSHRSRGRGPLVSRGRSRAEPPRRPGKLWTDVHSNLEGPEWNAPSFSSNPMGSLAASSDRSWPGSKTRATGSTRSTCARPRPKSWPPTTPSTKASPSTSRWSTPWPSARSSRSSPPDRERPPASARWRARPIRRPASPAPSEATSVATGVRRCRRTSSTDPTPRNRPTVRSESGTQPEATASAISEGALHLAVERPFGRDRPEAFRTAVIGPNRSGVRRTALRGEASVAQSRLEKNDQNWTTMQAKMMSIHSTDSAMFSLAKTRANGFASAREPKAPESTLWAVTATNIGIVTVHTTMHPGQPTPILSIET